MRSTRTMSYRTRSSLMGLLLSLTGLPVYGDAIVVTKAMTASTIAEFFIEDSRIQVDLEIGGRDLPGFRNLMPDGVYERMGYEAEPFEKRVGEFFTLDLVFRADDGKPLPGRILEMEPRKRVRRDEVTGEPMPSAEGDEEDVIFARLEYLLPGRPATLSMSPPQTEQGAPASTIGFVTYHDSLPVNDFRYFGTEETLDLDWTDPWYSRFRNRNLRRQYDSPLSAFLYVEPYEVRTEIIVRPLDMQQWIDLGIEGQETLPADEQYDLKMMIAEFLAGHQNLTIDGELVEPELDRVNFLRRTLRTSTVIDPPEDLDTVSATLGVIFVQPTEGLPQEASLTWDLWSDRIQRVPGAATDEAGPLRFFLEPDDNVLWWKNFLKNPTIPTLIDIVPPPSLAQRAAGRLSWVLAAGFVIGLVVTVRGAAKQGRRLRGGAIVTLGILLLATAGCFAASFSSRVTAERSEEIVAALLHNIYRSFDFRGEETIYDVLDRSVSGDLLTDIYLETRRGLELASQGGARAKVKEIEMMEVTAEKLRGEPGFSARCRWNVSGSVGHWGHIHTRTNQYEAQLRIQPIDGQWKVTDLEILEETRI